MEGGACLFKLVPFNERKLKHVQFVVILSPRIPVSPRSLFREMSFMRNKEGGITMDYGSYY